MNLRELRVPIDSDWEGRLETIQVNLLAFYTDIKSRQPVFDNDWVKANYTLSSENQHFIIKGNTNEIIIQDKDGNKIADFYELDNKLPHEWKDELDKEHEYNWDDAYIHVEGLGTIKILSLKYLYDIHKTEPEEIIISGRDTAKAILKDVETREIKFFDKSGNIK